MAEHVPSLLLDTPFAVVDVETTGFSPITGDRIVEIAIVRIQGSSTSEYRTLVNPLRDVGPTEVHGLTNEDVESAPLFSEIVGDVLEMLAGAVMVAHNVRYDREFVSVEVSSTGVFLPAVPSLCTLDLAYRFEPGLVNHRLSTCCFAAGIPHFSEHDALGDARAEAQLLRRYLRRAEEQGLTTLRDLKCQPVTFPIDEWPHLPCSGRRVERTGRASPESLPYLARVVASLGPVNASERIAPYLDLLDRVLEDQRVTEDEAKALHETAVRWGLSMEDVLAGHHAYLESVVFAATKDGRVTSAERRELEAVTRLLSIDPAMMHALLARAMEDPG